VAAAAPGSLLRTDRRLRRRKLVNRGMELAAAAAALAALAVLGILVESVAVKGAGAFGGDLFTHTTHIVGDFTTSSGIVDSIVGTIVIVGVATGMAVPVGVLVALYTHEFAHPRAARLIGLVLDVLNGVPSIVVGIFVFGLIVVGRGQSAVAGSVALAIVMLPLVARSTQEVLAVVPAHLREAGLGLGASRWRTVVGIVLPAALGGIVTGTTLAIARVAGETAPILFTSSIAANAVSWDPDQALWTLPLTIFVYAESPDPHDHEIAWAAALLLILFVLATSLIARWTLARTRQRLEGTAGARRARRALYGFGSGANR
jgi:phosphate transport system permease protein